MNLEIRYRSILALLLLVHLLLAGAYSVWNPLAEAPDEADHFAYVRYLTAERGLPSGSRVTQSKHPPLYHASAALAASAGDPLDYKFLRANPDVSIQPTRHWSPNFFVHTTLEDWPWREGPLAFHMARLWSVALSTLTVLATFFLVRSGFPGRTGLALAAAGVLAVIPEFAFIGGSVNNDSGAALAGALILWGTLVLHRRGGRWQAAWWAPVAMGLGLLTKVSTLALWPAVLLATVLGATQDEQQTADDRVAWLRAAGRSWRQWSTACLIILAIACVIAAPWLIRNWRLYGDPLGDALARQTIDLRPEPWTVADTMWLLKGWFQSFWGKFGAAGHLPMSSWIYWTLAASSLLAVAGLVLTWFWNRNLRPVLFLLALSAAMVALGIWRYSLVALGTDQGRLLYPAVSAIVTLLVVGIARLTPVRLRTSAAVTAIGLLAALSVYGLAGVIRPAFAPPPALEQTAAAAASTTEQVEFGDLTLVEWQTSPGPILRWHVATQPGDDWRTLLRITAKDGSLVWEWQRSPGYGRWSTDRWPAGTTLDDEYVVDWPAWAGPGRYRVEAGAHVYGGDLVVPVVQGQPAASPDHPYYFLGWLEKQ